MERLNGALRGQRYLIGGAFSRADLTACALLAPLCLPGLALPAVVHVLPAAVARFRAEQEDAPFFARVAETYRIRSRGPSRAGEVIRHPGGIAGVQWPRTAARCHTRTEMPVVVPEELA